MVDTIPVTAGKRRDLGVEQDIFPTFTIKLKDLPEVEGWTIGDRYPVNMLVELQGVVKSQHENVTEVTFKVVEIAPKSRDMTRHYGKQRDGLVRGSWMSTQE